MPAAGQLNVPCVLQLRLKSGRDLAGRDQLDWKDQEGTVWVALREPSDAEAKEFGGQTARVKWMGRTHWRSDIRPDSRLISGERVLHVVGAVDPFGDRSELRMRLTEDVPE